MLRVSCPARGADILIRSASYSWGLMAKRILLTLGVAVLVISGLGFAKYRQIQGAIKGSHFEPPPEAITSTRKTLEIAAKAGGIPVLALRPKQACQALGIGQRLLWSLTNRGVIPHVKLGKACRCCRSRARFAGLPCRTCMATSSEPGR